MRLSSIAHLYRVRLKVRMVLVQELLAVLGLSVGVALLFASQVASASLNGSVQQLASEFVGNMQLQLESRDPRGFDEGLLGQVRQLPGVSAAVPVLEEPAEAIGPTGRQAVELIGADPRLALRGSPLLKHFHYAQITRLHALALPSSVADRIGAQPLESIELQIGASNVSALVGTSLDATAIGGLAHSPVAVAPLAYVQKLTGMRDRVTAVFVRVMPGREREVRAGLQRLAADRLNVEPANFDVTLFGVAAAPADQGESLFSGISALVGFLFALNAMLLTLPLRQGLVAGLRSNGATRLDIVQALLFDAFVLGSSAALLGLALGDLLSIVVFRSNPGYLSFAFPVGSQRIVTWQSIAIAAGAGLLAACIGVLIPLREIFSASSRTTVPGGRHIRRWWTIGALIGGLACIAATTAILLTAPQSAVLGCVILVIALLLLLPLLLYAVLAVFDRLQTRFGSAATRIAVIELRSPKTRARSLAIAATGAIAVFGSVAIQGAHANLQQGLDRLVHQLSASAELWVMPPGTQNLLATTPFQKQHGFRPGASSRCSDCRLVSRKLSRLRRSPGMGARAAVFHCGSDSLEPTGERQSCAGERQASSRRLGCSLAGRRSSGAAACRAAFHAALPISDDAARRSADHQPRLASRCDHPQPSRLCACVGQCGTKCLHHHAPSWNPSTAGASGSSAGFGGGIGAHSPDCAATRRASASIQSPGAFPPDTDRNTRADRHGAGDVGGDGDDDLAAPSSTRSHEGSRL